MNYPLNISVHHQPSHAWGYCDYSPFTERNQWIEVEVSTNNAIYNTAPLTRNEGKGVRERKKRKGLVLARTKAVNSPESCISEGEMGGWSQANTNTQGWPKRICTAGPVFLLFKSWAPCPHLLPSSTSPRSCQQLGLSFTGTSFNEQSITLLFVYLSIYNMKSSMEPPASLVAFTACVHSRGRSAVAM